MVRRLQPCFSSKWQPLGLVFERDRNSVALGGTGDPADLQAARTDGFTYPNRLTATMRYRLSP